MRVAIVSDIHSNLAAFEAVMADLKDQDIDETWCLGDIVGYGPDPNECIELLRSYNPICIAGNHDWAAIGRISTEDFNPDAAAAIVWTTAQLTPENRQYLESLPLIFERDDITLAHGSPRDPIWEYVIFPGVAEANLPDFATSTCFVGHTHIPVIYLCKSLDGACASVEPSYDAPFSLTQGRQIINPGSIGQPRDGIPDSRYIVLDVDQRTIQHRRVSYDIAKTQREMQEANLPNRLWMRLSYGW